MKFTEASVVPSVNGTPDGSLYSESFCYCRSSLSGSSQTRAKFLQSKEAMEQGTVEAKAALKLALAQEGAPTIACPRPTEAVAPESGAGQ